MLSTMGGTPIRECDERKNNFPANVELQARTYDNQAAFYYPLKTLYAWLILSLVGAFYALDMFVLGPYRVRARVGGLDLPVRLGAYVVIAAVAVVIVIAVLIASFGFFMYVLSRMWAPSKGAPEDYITFANRRLERKWRGRAIPMETLFELYFAGKIDFNEDVLDTLRDNRYEFIAFRFNVEHMKFFVTQWIPELLSHTQAQDESQVRDHYDRGNDFYNAFLGRTMVYTSGIRYTAKDTLEDMQHQKIDLVMRKIHAQRGDRLLDIGCGWGTLAMRAQNKWGTEATGVTLSSEQIAWAEEVAETTGQTMPNLLRMDYRDIPKQKFDKITCLEMAEHVGVKNFNTFLLQVRDLLEDDGLFYMQIAGLRRCWQFEDLIWGLFMAKYVFPGADASAPLGWVVDHLEQCGWEVQSMDTIGCHYSLTLELWYKNWMANKDSIIDSYGLRWFRKWEVFLAWSSIISNQGSATAYQLVCHKNLNSFNRRSFWRRQLASVSDRK